jgi:hypothetical protein
MRDSSSISTLAPAADPRDELIAALVAVGADALESLCEDSMYGYFPGGDADPRDFTPEEDQCTAEEMERWRAACAAAARGEAPTTPGPHEPLVVDGVEVGHVTRAHFGVGVMVYRDARWRRVVDALRAVAP